MKHFFLAAFAALNFLFLPAVYSQADTSSEGIHPEKNYKLSEIVVSATRTPLNAMYAPSRVTRIDVAAMQKSGFDDMQSMLSFADGIFVKNYGTGQLATISLRGTAAEQTLFLFDGVNLNNIQNGQVDLFLVPVNNLSSIEISQGGSSALYGANAVGGVVNLESKISSNDHVRVDVGSGSYGNQIFGGEVSEGLGSARVDLIVQRQRGINDFDFTFNDGAKNFPMKFAGADYVEDMQSLKFAFPSSSSSTSFLIQNVSANRGTPYATSDSTLETTARETDKNTITVLKNIGHLGVFNYSASAGFIYSYLNYNDPSYATNDYYKTLSLQPSMQLSYFKEQFSIASGIDAELDRGKSDNMTGIKNRNRVGIFASGEYDVRKNVDLETRLFGALRYDDYSQFGNSLNPKLGINVKPLASFPVHLRANVGTSFRVPTFNDLYYRSQYYNGNPDLKPERATDYSLGGVVEYGDGQGPFYGDLNLDYYHIDIHDGIVYQTLPDFTGTEANLKRIVSKGVELSLNIKYESVFSLKGNHFFGKSSDVSIPGSPSYNKQLI
ncbi:MAG: TonB-dependent receptor, partial [Bacteroidota bacterium]|nr:TonB-dependent receptor [Bacteroidota bacterium]